jgi:hypothetical protein
LLWSRSSPRVMRENTHRNSFRPFPKKPSRPTSSSFASYETQWHWLQHHPNKCAAWGGTYFCYTGTAVQEHLLLNHPFRLVALMRHQSRSSPYETGILGKWISCMTAHTMVKQLVSVVKASIWSVRCRTLLKKLSMALVLRM